MIVKLSQRRKIVKKLRSTISTDIALLTLDRRGDYIKFLKSVKLVKKLRIVPDLQH